jgi:hypothetical protein
MDSSKGVHNPHYFEYIERLRGNNRFNNGCRRQQDIIAAISDQPIMSAVARRFPFAPASRPNVSLVS